MFSPRPYFHFSRLPLLKNKDRYIRRGFFTGGNGYLSGSRKTGRNKNVRVRIFNKYIQGKGERTPAPLSRAQPLITSSDINKLSSEGCIFFAPFSLFDDHVVIVCLLRGREKGVFLGRDGSERIASVFIEVSDKRQESFVSTLGKGKEAIL